MSIVPRFGKVLINGFVKHSIPDEVLENLMPWSEACKTACLPKMV